jgi:hypothetical protein
MRFNAELFCAIAYPKVPAVADNGRSCRQILPAPVPTGKGTYSLSAQKSQFQ